MTPQEVQKLLGGYATGTLTEAEQQALFEAALHDQALFDAVAREQSVRDLLRDPAARAHLLTALDPMPPRRFWTWRPIAAIAAMTAVATVAVVVARRPKPVVLVSQVAPPAAPAPLPDVPAVKSKPVGEGHDRPAPARPRPTSAPEPVSGAIVEVPKVEEARPDARKAKAESEAKAEAKDAAPAPPAATPQALEITAGAPVVQPPVVTARSNLLASENQPLNAPRFGVPAPGARQIFYGSQQRAAAGRAFSGVAGAVSQQPPANLALRYTILRRDPSGAFVEVDRADLAPADTIELRFTSNITGYLTVADAAPVSLTAMEPYTTPPLTVAAELKIIFAPQPQRQAPNAIALTEVQYRDTYVASRIPGQPLTFTIKLP